MKELRNNKRTMLLLLVLLVAVLGVGSVTLAKYVTQKKDKDTAIPTNFCFNSSYLKEEKPSQKYNVYTSVIQFDLKNYDGVNITEKDIDYSIIVTNDEGTDVTSQATVVGKTILTGSQESKKEISISGLPADTYTVTVTSTSPYSKTISADFVVHERDGSTVYKIVDNDITNGTDRYITLHIYTGNSPDVNVKFTEELEIDNTDSRMSGWTENIENVLSGLESNAHYELIFFEKAGSEEKDYTLGETKLTGNTIVIN